MPFTYIRYEKALYKWHIATWKCELGWFSLRGSAVDGPGDQFWGDHRWRDRSHEDAPSLQSDRSGEAM